MFEVENSCLGQGWFLAQSKFRNKKSKLFFKTFNKFAFKAENTSVFYLLQVKLNKTDQNELIFACGLDDSMFPTSMLQEKKVCITTVPHTFLTALP